MARSYRPSALSKLLIQSDQLVLHISPFSCDIESGKRMLLEGLRGKRPAIVIPRPWDFMPKEIAEYLIGNGVSSEAPVCVYERLTLPDESSFKGTLGALTRENRSFDDLSIMVIENY